MFYHNTFFITQITHESICYIYTVPWRVKCILKLKVQHYHWKSQCPCVDSMITAQSKWWKNRTQIHTMHSVYHIHRLTSVLLTCHICVALVSTRHIEKIWSDVLSQGHSCYFSQKDDILCTLRSVIPSPNVHKLQLGVIRTWLTASCLLASLSIPL